MIPESKFVGNCESLCVEDNRVSRQRLPGADSAVEGIRVYGHFVPFMLVRANHMDGFNVGIRARPIRSDVAATRKGQLWRVETNLLVGKGTVLSKTAEVQGRDNHPGAAEDA